MTLVLPYPVSANRYWRSVVPTGWKRAIVFPSDEAKAYRRKCAAALHQAGLQPVTFPITVKVRLYPRDRRLLDLDNALKVTIDALKGVAYADDKQVWRIEAERMHVDGRPRVEVEIHAYDPRPLELAA